MDCYGFRSMLLILLLFTSISYAQQLETLPIVEYVPEGIVEIYETDGPGLGGITDESLAELLQEDEPPTVEKVTPKPPRTAERTPVAPTRTFAPTRTSTPVRNSTTYKTPTKRTPSRNPATRNPATREPATEKPSSSRQSKAEDDRNAAVATGIGLIGVLGVVGYAAAAGKGVAIAKGVALATGATTAKGVAIAQGVTVAGGAGAASGAVSGSGAATVVEASLPIDYVDEGSFVECDAPLPEKPPKGVTRSYTDANGSQWTEVYNGQNWIDKASYEAANGQVADNMEWHEKQHEKLVNNDTAFDRQLAKNKLDHAKELKDIHKRNMKVIRGNAKLVQDTNELFQSMSESALQRVERVNDVLDTGKDLVDRAIPIVGAFTGPPGWVVGTCYTLGSETGAGIATGFVDPSKSIIAEGLKGLAKGTVNVVISEGMNSAMAVGGRLIRAGIKALPTKAGFTAALKLTTFNSPVPLEELGQLAKNLKRGVSSMKGIDTGAAFATVTDVASSFSLGGKSLATTAGRNITKKAFSTLGNGVFSSVRGTYIDSNIGGYVNEGLWGK